MIEGVKNRESTSRTRARMRMRTHLICPKTPECVRTHQLYQPYSPSHSPSPSRRRGEYRRPRPSPIQIRRPFWNSSKAASLLANRARSRPLDLTAACKHACNRPTDADGRTDGDPIEGNLNELSFAGKTLEWRPPPPPQTRRRLGKRQNE